MTQRRHGSHQVCSSRCHFHSGTFKCPIINMCTSVASSSGDKIMQEGEENVKRPHFLFYLLSVLSPLHLTLPHLPLTTVHLTDLDTVLTLCHLGHPSRFGVCPPLKNSGCRGCASVSSRLGWSHLAWPTTLKYALQTGNNLSAQDNCPWPELVRQDLWRKDEGKEEKGDRHTGCIK